MSVPPNPLADSINASAATLTWTIVKFVLLGIAIVTAFGLIVGLFTYGKPLKEPGKRADIWDNVFFIGMALMHKILDAIFQKRSASGSWLSDQQILSELRSMKPSEFEDFVGTLFERMGYQGEIVGGSGDGGVDIELTKDRRHYIVQCKKYITRNVTPTEVRDFFGAIGAHRADGGFFITTGIFTLEAKNFADGKFDAIDGTRLVQLVRDYKLSDHLESIHTIPAETCPRCHADLVIRKNKKTGNEFYGCTRYPKCKFTREV